MIDFAVILITGNKLTPMLEIGDSNHVFPDTLELPLRIVAIPPSSGIGLGMNAPVIAVASNKYVTVVFRDQPIATGFGSLFLDTRPQHPANDQRRDFHRASVATAYV